MLNEGLARTGRHHSLFYLWFNSKFSFSDIFYLILSRSVPTLSVIYIGEKYGLTRLLTLLHCKPCMVSLCRHQRLPVQISLWLTNQSALASVITNIPHERSSYNVRLWAGSGPCMFLPFGVAMPKSLPRYRLSLARVSPGPY